jgi:thioredoxin-like negative regulator of GroEL
LVKLDADDLDNEDLMVEHNVRSIPTLIAVVNDVAVGTLVGAKSEDYYCTWLTNIIERVELDG